MLKAFSIVHQERSDAVLFLIGDKLPSALQISVDSLGIRNNVRVYGPMLHADVVKFIVAADVCVGPLMATQANPLKIFEYMVCGKPVVTGRNSISITLSPEANFFVVDPEPVAISEALLRILKDRNYAESRVSNALKTVSNFSWERIGKDLESSLGEATRTHKKRYNFKQ